MSQAGFIAGMLAGRTALRRTNPDLLAWSHLQWELWIKAQHSYRADLADTPMLAVASLSCLEDLPLHIGLMQLIGIPDNHVALVLSLPTEEAARLARAQARRDGWSGLVRIVAENEANDLLDRLPGSALLTVFPIPGILAGQLLEHLAELRNAAKVPAAVDVSHNPNVFVGCAANYSDWSSAVGPVSERRLRTAIPLILSQKAKRLMPVSEYRDKPNTPLRPRGAWRGTVHAREGRIDIAEFRQTDELMVSANRDGDTEIFVRHRTCLQHSDQRLEIRVPPRLLTTTPQTIRMEILQGDGSTIATDLSFHVPPSRLKPWMVSAFLNRGGGGNAMIRAFAQGIACRIAYAEDEPSVLQDIPVVWGVLRDSDRILAQAKAQGLYYFYIDHAYFNRGHGQNYRITRNGYEAGPIRECPNDRASALGLTTSRWREGGRDIIVCPPTDYFMQAHGCPDWLDTTVATLRNQTDRPIIIRQKPQPGEVSTPLSQALETAHALVTHSSNVAIEAVCLGTPVFVSPSSAAAPVGRTDLSAIEDPVYPDRQPWLAHLAYNQFSYDEILEGDAWRMLLELEQRDFA